MRREAAVEIIDRRDADDPERSAGGAQRSSSAALCIVGVDPGIDSMDLFAKRLMGLAKHLVREQRRVPVSALATAMAHEGKAVELGLLWLESRGVVKVRRTPKGIMLREGEGRRSEDEAHLRSSVREALEEMAAFREFARVESWHMLVGQVSA